MAPKKEIPLQEIVSSQDEWDALLNKAALYVVDAHVNWTGPCKAVEGLFRKIKNELGDPLLNFATANVDNIDSLEHLRERCEPNFLFYGSGTLMGNVRGCNAPLLSNEIHKLIKIENDAQKGLCERVEVKGNTEGTEMEGAEGGEGEEEDDDGEEKDSLFDEAPRQLTCAVIKPDVVKNDQLGEIMEKILDYGMEVVEQVEVELTEEIVKDFYSEHKNETYFLELVEYMTSGPSVVLALTDKLNNGLDTVQRWRDLIGPFDAAIAKDENPESLRALYGTDAAINGMHGSSNIEEAEREIAFFFPEMKAPTYPKINPTRAASCRYRRTGSGRKLQRTLAIIRPSALKQFRDEIMEEIEQLNLDVAFKKEFVFTEEQIEALYKEHSEQDYYPHLVKEMESGPSLVLCLTGEEALSEWKKAIGPSDPKELDKDKDCLRSKYQVEGGSVNLIHGSDNQDQAENELRAFFQLDQTLALIKPEGFQFKDRIISQFEEEGLMLSHMKMIDLDTETAEEIYKNKEEAPFFDNLIKQLTSGPCLAVVLSAENAVKKLRRLIGPVDPVKARKFRPKSLRARFGYSMMLNSVHGVSNDRDADYYINFLFGATHFEWDGYMVLDPMKAMEVPVSRVLPRMRDLGEEEPHTDDDVLSEGEFSDTEDPGPLFVLEEKRKAEAAIEAERLAAAEAERAALEAAQEAEKKAKKAAKKKNSKKRKKKSSKKGKRSKEGATTQEEEQQSHPKPELEDFGLRTIRTWSKIKMDEAASNTDVSRGASRLGATPSPGLGASNTDVPKSRNNLLRGISEKEGNVSQIKEDEEEGVEIPVPEVKDNKKTVTIAEPENKDPNEDQTKEEASKDEEAKEGVKPAEDEPETKSLTGNNDVTEGEDPNSKLPDPSGIKAEISRRISKSSGKSHMSYESSTSLSSITSQASSSRDGSSSSGEWDSSEDEDSSKSSLSFDDGEESSSSSSTEEQSGRN